MLSLNKNYKFHCKPSLEVPQSIQATFSFRDLELWPMTLTLNLTRIVSRWTKTPSI